MASEKPSTERRDRGRPQLRPDDETRQIIYEAARHEFAANGYAATSTDTVSDFNLHVTEDADIETGLNAALMACADLTLDPEVVALQRIILQDSKFSDLAATFYTRGIVRTAAALSSWLRQQVRRRLIELDNVEEAAGMLIGMVASAPQRAAIYGGVKLPSRVQIEARVARCVALFLRGCEAKGRAR
jgi:hypothetical protein